MKKAPPKQTLRKYTVTLTRTIEHTAVVEHVDATSQADAIDKAILYADSDEGQRLWREGDTIGESSIARTIL